MVLPDWSRKPASEKSRLPFSLAGVRALSRPTDRLAATIIDIFVILMPAYLLFSAPLKTKLTTSFLLGSDAGVFLFICLNFFVAVALITSYQAYMHSRFGATVGKLIFNLRVQSIWGHSKPSLFVAAKRSLVWQLEFLACCVPMLGIFTDPQRRILHDRICDTEVISLKDHGVLPPKPFEQKVVYSVFGFFGLMVSLSLLVSLLQGMRHVGQDRSLASILSKSDTSCEEVTAAIDNLQHESELEKSSRLQIAMSLYAAGLVEKSCLAGESEQELDVNFISSPLAYLAKAFVHSDDAEFSDAYLEEVCKEGPGTPECSMSELVSKWSEEDWRGVDKVIAQAPSGSVYLEIWAIRHFMKQGDFKQALEFVDKISPNRTVATFLQTQRAKALWSLDRSDEAEIAVSQAMETMAPSEQISLASWLCGEQLISSCDHHQSPSCQWVQKNQEKDRLDISETMIGLASLRIKECSSAKVDYIQLADGLSDDSWKTFLQASSKDPKTDFESASALYARVVRFSEAADELRLEALRRFLKISQTHDMVDIVSAWREMKSGELWRKAGNLLVISLMDREEKTAALKVARSLMSQSALSDANMKTLASYVQSSQDRRPASEGLGEKVKALLDTAEDRQ